VAALQFTLLDQATNLAHWIGNTSGIGYLQTVDLVGAKYLIFGLILVLMMIFRREGIWPSQRRAIELHAEEDDSGPGENMILAEENQQLYDVQSGRSALSGK